jgi:hypothetical protein
MFKSIWEKVLAIIVPVVGEIATNNPAEVQISIPIGNTKESSGGKMEINWDDPEAMISNHFKVREALWLPSWQVMHVPSQDEKDNILEQAAKMDMVREFLGVPIVVHCWMRPVLNNPISLHNGEDYNALVGGAKSSAHKIGKATDWNPVGMTCEEARQKLIPKLEEFDIRLEDNGVDANWCHTDCAPVLHSRFFKP